MKPEIITAYCYRCMCERPQTVCPPHYSVTSKYRCTYCHKINSDTKYCFKMPAPIVFR